MSEWPNVAWWGALEDGKIINQHLFDEMHAVKLRIMDCGKLVLPYGRLVACDPFVFLEAENNYHINIPPGKYPVKVTMADVSGKGDGSHEREAYATLLLNDLPEVQRRPLEPLPDGELPSAESLHPDEVFGFSVDAGTACFVDDGSVKAGMPSPQDWLEQVFEHEGQDSWFNRMDDPEHIRAGLANVPLPKATDGANIIIIHSGWGDGFYPIVGGYDKDGHLVRVHIDFGVISDPNAIEV